MTNWKPTMDPDTAIAVLAHAHRRAILYCLIQDGEVLNRDELASRIAAWERSTEEHPSDEIHQQICTQLVHSHLPKLAAAGVIEYDRRQGDVTLADTVDDLMPLLELTSDADNFFNEEPGCPLQ